MKNLIDFLNESLVMELSSDTYKKAAEKAKQIGDVKRFKKFMQAYAKSVAAELKDTPEAKLNSYYKEDKPVFNSIKKYRDGRSDDIDTIYTIGAYHYFMVDNEVAGGDSNYKFLPRTWNDKMTNYFGGDYSTKNGRYVAGSILIKDDDARRSVMGDRIYIPETNFVYDLNKDKLLLCATPEYGNGTGIPAGYEDVEEWGKDAVAKFIAAVNNGSKYANKDNVKTVM